MTTQTPQTIEVTLTAAERHALRAVRKRHSETRDLFSPEELARMQFVKWLAREGRLES
jgi:hypothetical protein